MKRKLMCCFSNLKRNMKSCRCFSDHGNEGWHTATMKGSCKARFQKSRSTAFGKRKTFNTRFDVLSQDVESSKTPSSSPRLSGFCESPSLVDTGKKVEEVDARALRQLDLCLRVHAKIASGVYPSPPPGTLSGPVCAFSSGSAGRADGRPDVSRGSRVSPVTALATADENKGIVGLHAVNELDSDRSKAVVGTAAEGVNKGLDELLVVNESDCFSTDVVDMTATASVGSDIVAMQAEDESVRFGSDAGFAAATAGESERIIRLHEVSDSAFPSLSNSSHNSCLRLSTSACARASCFAGACAGVLLLVFALFHRLLRYLLLYMRMPQPCTVHRIRGRTRVGLRVPRGGGAPKVGFPVRPKICVLSQRWRQG